MHRPSTLRVQRAETSAAVRLEWAHAQCFGQGDGLTVEGFALLDLWGITVGSDLAEEAQGIRLVIALLVRPGERQRVCSEGVSLLQVASQHLGLPEGETTDHLTVEDALRRGPSHRLGEQWHRLSHLQPFYPVGTAIRKQPLFSVALGEVRTGVSPQ